MKLSAAFSGTSAFLFLLKLLGPNFGSALRDSSSLMVVPVISFSNEPMTPSTIGIDFFLVMNNICAFAMAANFPLASPNRKPPRMIPSEVAVIFAEAFKLASTDPSPPTLISPKVGTPIETPPKYQCWPLHLRLLILH